MSRVHLTEMILNRVLTYKTRPALFYKKSGQWESISWDDMGNQIKCVSRALLQLGLGEQERVGIYSQNKPQWTIADYGIMGVRGITTTIYATNSASDAEYIVNDAEMGIIFVGGQEQYDNVMRFFRSNKYLKQIVVFDNTVKIEPDENILYFDDFIKQGLAAANEAAYNERLSRATADDVATIIYTSGTSGTPKGVMLTQANLFSQFTALDPLFNICENDIELCFLPLSHSYQKASTLWTQSHGVTVYYCENPKEILEQFQEVRPTFMVGVPRLYEKMYATVYARLEEASWLKKKLFNWALRIGKAYQYKTFEKRAVSGALNLKHNLARKLVLNKIREIMGGRLNFFSAGGAPLSSEIEEFFFAAGIFIAQGYGLTETSPVISCNRLDKFKFGTPGTVVSICQVKIAEDGEILVKGDNVMKGYFRKPELTAEAFTADGWFKTGDIGNMDEEGFLYITDRKKDIIITAGGKNIAPQSIESLFGKDYYIEQLAVIGDRKKYITALVVPALDALKEFATTHQIKYFSIAELVKNKHVLAFYEKRLHKMSESLAHFEKIKKFTLLPEPFSQERGEITPTLKIKRKTLEENYKGMIEKMYMPDYS
ncbi:long-chain fatty acid--CoA ligase [candidate division KSB1 bacterium]|nr:long-chain fatty acid--CoA ligase [candidate division KSB1 bacterium]